VVPAVDILRAGLSAPSLADGEARKDSVTRKHAPWTVRYVTPMTHHCVNLRRAGVTGHATRWKQSQLGHSHMTFPLWGVQIFHVEAPDSHGGHGTLIPRLSTRAQDCALVWLCREHLVELSDSEAVVLVPSCFLTLATLATCPDRVRLGTCS
jgi:hypothetical protein